MYSRHLEMAVAESLEDTPVIYIRGPRQAGKSTLVQAISRKQPQLSYFSLDNHATLAAATRDPVGFIDQAGKHAVIDEIQRNMDLILPIKASVDKDRAPGRFILTGSADILMNPRLADSLAGRMDVRTLWPLSYGERHGVKEGFVDAVFRETLPPRVSSTLNFDEFMVDLVTGAFPEVVGRKSARRRANWFEAYLSTVIEREVRSLAEIEGLSSLPGLLTIVASRAGGILNIADLSRVAGLTQPTLRKYLTLLKAIFLVWELQPWARNLERRVVKSPKIYLTDTGLLTHLQGVDAASLTAGRTRLGPILENFVGMEMRKQLGWSEVGAKLHHFRTHDGREVDFVLERRGGRIVGIEVKASSTVTASDFKGLTALQDAAGDDFVRGIILYLGKEALPFGPRAWALPVDALWTLGASPELVN